MEGGRRRIAKEDRALDQITREGQAQLAAIRQARTEAREIRMRELERKQREQDENADRTFELTHLASSLDEAAAGDRSGGTTGAKPIPATATGTSGAMVAPRIDRAVAELAASSAKIVASSNQPLNAKEELTQTMSSVLKEVRDCFQAIMVEIAQLDNERAAFGYQIDLLKDQLNDVQESFSQAQREYRDKCKELAAMKRENEKLGEQLGLVTGQLEERDSLIAQHGLLIISVENEEGTDAHRVLVTDENAHLLQSAAGTLDARLTKFRKEKAGLEAQLEQAKQELKSNRLKALSLMEEQDEREEDHERALRYSNRVVSEYRVRLHNLQTEIGCLKSKLAHSESLVVRYSSAAEAGELAETELKHERRKLQREKREVEDRVEELKAAYHHLLARLE